MSNLHDLSPAGTVHLHKAQLEVALDHARNDHAGYDPRAEGSRCPAVSGEIVRTRSWTIPVVVLTAVLLVTSVVLSVVL